MRFRLRKSIELQNEDGAVTVDWVVLTALIVPLGMLVGGALWNATSEASHKIGDAVAAQSTVLP